MERRQQLHECAGAALETLYASMVEEHLADLAHLYGRSGNALKAVNYLRLAAQQAMDRSAYVEAKVSSPPLSSYSGRYLVIRSELEPSLHCCLVRPAAGLTSALLWQLSKS